MSVQFMLPAVRATSRGRLVSYISPFHNRFTRNIYDSIDTRRSDSDSDTTKNVKDGYKTIRYQFNVDAPLVLEPIKPLLEENTLNPEQGIATDANSKIPIISEFEDATSLNKNLPDTSQTESLGFSLKPQFPNDTIFANEISPTNLNGSSSLPSGFIFEDSNNPFNGKFQPEPIPDINLPNFLSDSQLNETESHTTSSDSMFSLPVPTAVEPSLFWPSMFVDSNKSSLPCSLPDFVQNLVSILKWRIKVMQEIHEYAELASLNFMFPQSAISKTDLSSPSLLTPFGSLIDSDLSKFINIDAAKKYYEKQSTTSEQNLDDVVDERHLLTEFESILSQWADGGLSLQLIHKPHRFSVTDMTTLYCEPRTFYDIIFQKNTSSKSWAYPKFLNDDISVTVFKEMVLYMFYDPVFDMFADFAKNTKTKVKVFRQKKKLLKSYDKNNDALEKMLYDSFQDFSSQLGVKLAESLKMLNNSKYYFANNPQNTFKQFKDLLDHGKISKRQKTFMDSGTALHKKIEESIKAETDLTLPDIEELKLSSSGVWASRFLDTMMKMQNMYIRAIELSKNGMDATSLSLSNSLKAREIYVFGEHNGNIITGFIDQVGLEVFNEAEMFDAKETGDSSASSSSGLPSDLMLVVTDTKTRMSPTLPPLSQRISAYHQVLIYQKLLSDMCSGNFDFELLYKTQNLDPDAPISWELLLLYTGWDEITATQTARFDVNILKTLNASIDKAVEKIASQSPQLSNLSISNNPYFTLLSSSDFDDSVFDLGLSNDSSDERYTKNGWGLVYQNPSIENNKRFVVKLPNITLRQIQTELNKTLQLFSGKVSDKVAVEYIFQTSNKNNSFNNIRDEIEPKTRAEILAYKSDPKRLEKLLEYSENFWVGQRDPIGPPVDELTKCKYCEWKNICSWTKKADYVR